MRLAPPMFFVIGAEKAGTTSLYRYLRQHPQVLLSDPKEPHAFSFGWDRDGSLPEGYRDLFRTHRGEVTGGECSTSYLWHQDAPHRLRSAVPEARIVAVLRDPIDRAWSHYLMNRRLGLRSSFEEMVHPDHEWITHGEYSRQIYRWLQHFEPDQILVQYQEEMALEPRRVLRRICRHFGVNPHAADSIDVEKRYNVARVPRRPRLAALVRSGPVQAVKGILPAPVRDAVGQACTAPQARPDMPLDLREALEPWFRESVHELRDMAAQGLVPRVPWRGYQ